MADGQLERVKELLETLSNRDSAEIARLLLPEPRPIRDEVSRLLRLRAEKGAFLETPAILAGNSEEPDGLIGLLLDGRFLLRQALAAGGFGTAFLALDSRLKREVVVKILHRGVLSDESAATEIEALSRIEHPGVVGILDAGKAADGRIFIVTRFVPGASLRMLIDQGRVFSEADVTKIGLQLAEALSFAHRRGVLHLDITPENVVLEDLGGGETRPVLLDFGVARLQDPSGKNAAYSQLAPSHYRPPELANGEPADWSSDYYSVAAILREMLAGTSTWNFNLGRSPQWDKFVRTALAPSKRDRFASPDAFRMALSGRSSTNYFAFAVASLLILIGTVALVHYISRQAPSSRISDPRPLTTLQGDEEKPDVSPDGRTVYFSWTRDGRAADICRIREGSANPVCLTSNPAIDTDPKCSPDGNSVAFLRDLGKGLQSLTLVPSEGGSEIELAQGYFNSLAWSRNGKTLVVSDTEGPDKTHSLRAFNLTDRTWRQITRLPESFLGDFSPSFSPDGRQLAFVRAFDRAKVQILITQVDDSLQSVSSPRVIAEVGGSVRNPVWSDDAATIFFLMGTSSNHTLWRVSASGGTPHQRVVEAGANLDHLAISGRTLIVSKEFTDSDIWRSDLAAPGGKVVNSVRIAKSTYPDEEPRISPDGQRILFESARSGDQQYWIADLDGNKERQITNSPRPNDPALRWMPNGAGLLSTGLFRGVASVRVADLEQKGPNPFRNLPFQRPVTIGVSRDGRNFYITEPRNGRLRVLRVSIETLQATEVVEAPAIYAIESLDGKTLYYCGRPASFGLWRVPVTGGRPEQLLESVSRRSFAVGKEGIYYVSRTGDRHLNYFDLQRALSRVLLEAPGPLSWGIDTSSDERTIVYSALVKDGSDLQTLSIASP